MSRLRVSWLQAGPLGSCESRAAAGKFYQHSVFNCCTHACVCRQDRHESAMKAGELLGAKAGHLHHNEDWAQAWVVSLSISLSRLCATRSTLANQIAENLFLNHKLARPLPTRKGTRTRPQGGWMSWLGSWILDPRSSLGILFLGQVAQQHSSTVAQQHSTITVKATAALRY